MLGPKRREVSTSEDAHSWLQNREKRKFFRPQKVNAAADGRNDSLTLLPRIMREKNFVAKFFVNCSAAPADDSFLFSNSTFRRNAFAACHGFRKERKQCNRD